MKKLLIIVSFSLLITACNMFESIDKAKDTEEVKAFKQEQALREGDFAESVNIAEETINGDSDMRATSNESEEVASKVKFDVTSLSAIQISNATINDITTLNTEDMVKAIATTTNSAVAIEGAKKVYEDISKPLENLINKNISKAKEYTEAKTTIAESKMGQGNLKTTDVLDSFTGNANLAGNIVANTSSNDDFSIADLIEVNHNYKKAYLQGALDEFMKALVKDITKFKNMKEIIPNYTDKYTAEMVTGGVWLAIEITDVFANKDQSKTQDKWIFKKYSNLTDEDKLAWMKIKPKVIITLTNLRAKLMMLLGVTEDQNGNLSAKDPSKVVNIKLLKDNYDDFYDVVDEFDNVLEKISSITFSDSINDTTEQTNYEGLLNQLGVATEQ
ncbi:hypothetical protein EV215_1744 [Hypnocyclicus thermotrophus]|uniref:Lipoprotein n=1 Tax=Hypnocyclicus thermotrophus TaxID=1627895 RepID=A0AA46I5E8_9FUSO|nr:hypothetical protein [Hypnocyclicus thermotrophus]TDT68024.1 hypothetical protein EV215_1744 [Hypnocyclicus thermotrophus]